MNKEIKEINLIRFKFKVASDRLYIYIFFFFGKKKEDFFRSRVTETCTRPNKYTMTAKYLEFKMSCHCPVMSYRNEEKETRK